VRECHLPPTDFNKPRHFPLFCHFPGPTPRAIRSEGFLFISNQFLFQRMDVPGIPPFFSFLCGAQAMAPSTWALTGKKTPPSLFFSPPRGLVRRFLFPFPRRIGWEGCPFDGPSPLPLFTPQQAKSPFFLFFLCVSFLRKTVISLFFPRKLLPQS